VLSRLGSAVPGDTDARALQPHEVSYLFDPMLVNVNGPARPAFLPWISRKRALLLLSTLSVLAEAGDSHLFLQQAQELGDDEDERQVEETSAR
jgi:hypothetical protein